jgi:uncharacterized protein (DUF305 family)
MMKSTRWVGVAVLVTTIAVAGCSTTARQSASEPVRPMSAGETVLTPAAQAKADSGRPPYTVADARFMQGMIRHHGQAIVMAAWAQTRAARNDVRILASRIDVAQRDEIALMQRWLRERREMVPDAHTEHAMAGHQMSGSGPLMPGMLTPEQLAQLEKATGPEFDRLFLTFMIQHHEGALTMVRELFASPGAGQDATIFRFASDVEADQTTEIDRMHTMLAPQRNQP